MCRVLSAKKFRNANTFLRLKCQIIISHLSVNSRGAIRCRLFHDADFTNVVAFLKVLRKIKTFVQAKLSILGFGIVNINYGFGNSPRTFFKST
jgi:hypothetical protein